MYHIRFLIRNMFATTSKMIVHTLQNITDLVKNTYSNYIRDKLHYYPIWVGPTLFYISWVIVHFISAQLYSHHCAYFSWKGFLISPLMAVTPYCQGIEWMLRNSIEIIKNMWILIGSLISTYVSLGLHMNNTPYAPRLRVKEEKTVSVGEVIDLTHDEITNEMQVNEDGETNREENNKEKKQQ